MLARIDNNDAVSGSVLKKLEEDGIVVLPDLLSSSQLASMQRAFESRLKRARWNDFDGYEQTEIYRHMVHDVLTLDQGFVDLALNPIIKRVLDSYLGPSYELTEAKGWKSLPTKRDFHGWHGDAWYDQAGTTVIHREVKMALYLSDVSTGAFNYVKGSHLKQHPRSVKNSELRDVPASQIVELLGPAGTAFLFDTSGIHRQGVPMLKERQAIFYNYHDPAVPLQREDIEYDRYHPLSLNAAFLGGLSKEDERILGFGRTTNYIPAFQRADKHTFLQECFRRLYIGKLHAIDFRERIKARMRRTFGK
jgi:Phytanoyl-CoA dioxygenase (PhyH)